MNERHFTLLGLTHDATLSDLKAAYHRLAKRNHPDLFPEDQRRRQQLKMMRINEAYMSVMSDLVDGPRTGAAPVERRAGQNSVNPAGVNADAPRSRRETQTQFFRAWDLKAHPGAPSHSRAVGGPRDPAYAYYKAGFRYYNLGTTELSRHDAPKIRRHLLKFGTADGYILKLAIRALHYFERSYTFFSVVVEEYPESAWSHDARYKMHRLEKFSRIYQRICENLSRRSSTNRSSFSMVSGADPS